MADWRSGGGRLNNGFPHDRRVDRLRRLLKRRCF
jgi:hypothetical protein